MNFKMDLNLHQPQQPQLPRSHLEKTAQMETRISLLERRVGALENARRAGEFNQMVCARSCEGFCDIEKECKNCSRARY
jgi:hypothetical protein